VSNPVDRPPILADAAGALAYAKWLQANGLEDSDAAAWRFAAEMAGAPAASSTTPDPAPAPARARAKRRWWVPVSIVAAVLVLLGGVAVYAVATAERWTKIDVAETTRWVNVPRGEWEVYEGLYDPVCIVGQNYLGCINDMTVEYNRACVGRNLTPKSRDLCDRYLQHIQEMKARNPPADSVVAEGGPNDVYSGRLTARELTKPKRVVDVPAQSHEAVCYLGFLGECPTPEDADQSP